MGVRRQKRSGRPGAVAATPALGLLVAVALLGACAAPSGSTAAFSGRKVAIPAIAHGGGTGLRVDGSLVDALACDACADAGGSPLDPARFFYGLLPLAATDALVVGPTPDAASVRSHLGSMFASGWFGGLYLRANLSSIGAASGAGAGAPDPVRDLVLVAVGDATYGSLDGFATQVSRTARWGSPAEVRSASAALSRLLAAVHGYNRGYLEVAIANPPPGAPAPPALDCDGPFDCRVDSLPLASLDALAGTLDRLSTPPDQRWAALAGSLGSIGESAVAGGRSVWEGLLGGADFDADAYAAIIELSYGFLEVTQAALLGVAEGAVGDVATGRRGLLAAAALIVWAGSYFMGLAADAPTDVLPALDCAG
jgi:hypothetical protein